MIRHVVLLTFREGTTEEEISAIEAALSGLPGRIPSLLSYSFGRDLGIDEGNASFVVVAEVEDEAGYSAYRDDPEHRRIIVELVRPAVASRTAVQTRI